MNLTSRSYTKEVLDDLSLKGRPLKKTLASLQFINSVFGNHYQMTKAIEKCCFPLKHKNTIRIVDLGCGSGDLIRYIHKSLAKKGIKATFLGIDGNPETVRMAKSENKCLKQIDFSVADILDSKFIIPECEILISSHFIYHFEDMNLIKFLNKIQKQNISYVLFSELYRSEYAYWLFKIFKEFLPISTIAKKDGLLAIQRAYSVSELDQILQKSTCNQYTITKKIWFRSITKISNL